MIELTCVVCGARPIDEFRSLRTRAGAGERWWHAQGCRQVSRFEWGAEDRLVPWSDEPVVAQPALPEVVWLTPPGPSGEVEPPPRPTVPLPSRRRDVAPMPLAAAPLPSSAPAASAAPGGPGPIPGEPISSGPGVPVASGPGVPVASVVPAPVLPAPDAPAQVNDLVVALPDEPPVPFERPLWPSGPEPEPEAGVGPSPVPLAPPPPAPSPAPFSSAAPPVEDIDRNDRFRQGRATARPVERVVRRPVGLVGPNQPRAVDVTRRPTVEGQRFGGRNPGVEPKVPASAAASSLFSRGRDWGDDDDLDAGAGGEPGTGPGDEPGHAVGARAEAEGEATTGGGADHVTADHVTADRADEATSADPALSVDHVTADEAGPASQQASATTPTQEVTTR